MLAETKAQPVVQAQLEHYLHEQVQDFQTEKLFLKYLEQLSSIGNLNKIPEDFPVELKSLIADHKDAYILFLRKTRRQEREFLEKNIRLYNERFKPVVQELKRKIASVDHPREVEEFLGSGGNGSAFKVVIDGRTLVIKFTDSLYQNNFEIKPLLRTRHIPHTPELVAFSLEDGVKIMSYLPGEVVSNFTPENAPAYPDEHIIQLIETVLELERNGIALDPRPSNFVYSSQDGFGVFDFRLSSGSRFSEPQQQVMSLYNVLTSRKFPSYDWRDDNACKRNKILRGSIYFPMLIRFLTIMQTSYPQLLEKWQQQLDEDRANPLVGVSELVDRDYWRTTDPEINQYLATLSSMGF